MRMVAGRECGLEVKRVRAIGAVAPGPWSDVAVESLRMRTGRLICCSTCAAIIRKLVMHRVKDVRENDARWM